MLRPVFCFFMAISAAVFCAFLPDAQAAAPPYPFDYKRLSQIADHAGVLNKKVAGELIGVAGDAEYYTGRQMIIVTVPTFRGWPPERVAEYYGRKMGLGQEKSGVLLVVGQKERAAQVGIGPGLERLITPRVVKAILDNEVTPELLKGDYQQAVRKGTRALADALEGSYKTPAEKRKQYLPFAILLPVLILMKVLFGRGQGRSFFGGGAWRRW